MSERWEPKRGDKYYYINESLVVEVDRNECTSTDKKRIYCANCFHTVKEAGAAAEKVRELMLSLHEPSKECKRLPDWCKVGEWCYCLDDDGNPKYFKITSIKDNYIYGEDWDIDYHFIRQARLRPYSADEMRSLVGKVFTTVTGEASIATDFDPSINEICICGEWLNRNSLSSSAWLFDDKPCCKLEHLENGEWVE